MQASLNHRTTSRFWECYGRLPPKVRSLADANFALLKANPSHPSLHLKQIGRFWSVRVGLRYRALGISKDDSLIWFWIGNHVDYDRMIG